MTQRTLGIVVAVLVGITFMGSGAWGPAAGKQPTARLIVILRESADTTGRPLPKRDLLIELSNGSDAAIRVDEESLNPGLLCRVYDRNGNEISYLPCGPPSPPPEQRPVRILAVGERLELSFKLEQLTDDQLRRKPYRIECCYDTTWLPQDSEAPIDRIGACATPLTLR